MKKIITLIALTTLSTSIVIAGGSASSDAGKKIISKISQNQAVVTDTFALKNGIDGYVVAASNNADDKQILFTASNGEYLILGNLINQKGENLTETYTQKYITGEKSAKAYKEADKLSYVADGNDNAPHKMYILLDPNCHFCHEMYKEVNNSKLVKDGKLQVRWIPVGFLRQDSLGKAAAIITQNGKVKKSNAGFDGTDITAISESTKNPAELEAISEVKANTKFFSENGFGGTPVLIYKTEKGEANFIAGYVQGTKFTDLVDTMSSSWK